MNAGMEIVIGADDADAVIAALWGRATMHEEILAQCLWAYRPLLAWSDELPADADSWAIIVHDGTPSLVWYDAETREYRTSADDMDAGTAYDPDAYYIDRPLADDHPAMIAWRTIAPDDVASVEPRRECDHIVTVPETVAIHFVTELLDAAIEQHIRPCEALAAHLALRFGDTIHRGANGTRNWEIVLLRGGLYYITWCKYDDAPETICAIADIPRGHPALDCLDYTHPDEIRRWEAVNDPCPCGCDCDCGHGVICPDCGCECAECAACEAS